MMNFNQLAELIKQGFTEEQIRAVYTVMSGDTLTPTNTNTNTSTSTTTPTPTPTPTTATPPAPVDPPKPADTTPPAPSAPAESETVTLLKEMLGLIRKGNIGAMGGTVAEPSDASDVLAEILNPTPKTK